MVSLGFILIGCGGDNGAGPTPTASSIVVSLGANEILVGQTTQATATLRQGNGATVPVTSGWRSDNVGVASVTDSGTVEGLSNGRATVFVNSEGRQGQTVIRVYPKYHGSWTGSKTYGTCLEATGDWIELCPSQPSGSTFNATLSITQNLASVEGTFGIFSDDAFAPFTTTVQADGRLEFSSEWVNANGLRINASWNVISTTTTGWMTGMLIQEFTHPNLSGSSKEQLEVSLYWRSALPARSFERDLLGRRGSRLWDESHK